MNNVITQNLLRLFFIVLVQAVVLQQAKLGGNAFNYISLFLYPLFLFLLPLKTPKITLVLIGFGLGIIIDICYNSPGLHAAACLVTAILRPLALAIFEPREGYKSNNALNIKNYGIPWFLKYVGTLLSIHLFIYFILEIFTPLKIGEIILRTIASFIFSILIMGAYMILARPKV